MTETIERAARYSLWTKKRPFLIGGEAAIGVLDMDENRFAPFAAGTEEDAWDYFRGLMDGTRGPHNATWIQLDGPTDLGVAERAEKASESRERMEKLMRLATQAERLGFDVMLTVNGEERSLWISDPTSAVSNDA